jgi:hypothetical protein
MIDSGQAENIFQKAILTDQVGDVPLYFYVLPVPAGVCSAASTQHSTCSDQPRREGSEVPFFNSAAPGLPGLPDLNLAACQQHLP